MFNKYKPHYKSNLKLAIPVVISQLGHPMVSFFSAMIVGQFSGTLALAAVALANSYFNLCMITGIGISFGLTPLIAQEDGRKDYFNCGRLLSHSLVINLISGLLLFACIYAGAVFGLEHMGQTIEVAREAGPLLKWLGLSIIPLMIFLTFKQFAEGLGLTKQAMQISIWGNIINIIAGIILVKGMFGIPPMGVRGIGYSTLIDRTIMALAMSIFVLRSQKCRKYLKGFRLGGFTKNYFKQLTNMGIPVALQYIFEASTFSAAAIMVGWIGAVEQAAHLVAMNIATMTYMMASGLSAAAAIRSGNHTGMKDFRQLRISAISSYHITIVMMLIAGLLMVIFKDWLPLLFSEDLSLIHIASGLLVIAAFFQIFDGTQVVGLGILRGMGDVKLPTLFTFIAYWGFGMPIAWLLGIHTSLGVYGIWLGLLIGLLISSVLLFFRFQRISRPENSKQITTMLPD